MSGFYVVGPSNRVVYGKGFSSDDPLDDDILLGMDMFNLLHPDISVGSEFFNSLKTVGSEISPDIDFSNNIVVWWVWDNSKHCWKAWGSA